MKSRLALVAVALLTFVGTTVRSPDKADVALLVLRAESGCRMCANDLTKSNRFAAKCNCISRCNVALDVPTISRGFQFHVT